MLDRKRAMRLVLALIGAGALSTGCNPPSTPSESAEKSKSDVAKVAQKSSNPPPDAAPSDVETPAADPKVERADPRPVVDPPAGKKPADDLQADKPPAVKSSGPVKAASAAPKVAAKRPDVANDDEAEKKAADDFKNAFSNIGKRDDKQDDRKPTKIVRLPPPDAKRFPGLMQFDKKKDFDVWIDLKNKRLVLQSEVCLRKGALELFACIHHWIDDPSLKGSKLRRGTKEHESIVTINSTAALVNAGLLLIGADRGSPARFRPKYVPARGSEVEIMLHWQDVQGKWQQARAQDWIRDHETKKKMTHPWVFAGSRFWVDKETGKEFFTAESGDLICVSNFDTAVLDLPIESSGAAEELLFEAFTERIPKAVLGLTVVEAEGGTCKITAVKDNSPASRAGLKAGDVIVEAEFEKLTGLKHWKELHAKQRPTSEMLLKIKRGKESIEKRFMPDGAVVTMVLTYKPMKKKPADAAKKKEKTKDAEKKAK